MAYQRISNNFSWPYEKARDIFYTRRQQVKDLEIAWTIGPHDLEWPETCPLLGIPLNYTKGQGRTDNSPSIDRIVPHLGYIPGNVIVISWRANRIKNNGNSKELRAISDWLAVQETKWKL